MLEQKTQKGLAAYL